MSESVIDFAALETPTLDASVETPTTGEETTVEETQPTTETQPEGTESQPPGTEADKGKPPTLKVMRDAVKAFEQTNPELGKHLKSLLDNEGRIRAYQGEFPDVESARSMRAAVEAAGGLDGITELSRLRESVEETDAMIESGDPQVIERLFSDGKEGPTKLLPHYMNRVEKENPEAFGNTIRPHLVRSLQASNFENVLAALSRATADKPEAKEIVDSVVGWFNDQKRLSEKTNLDALEPERGKLKEEWGKVTSEKNKIFENEVTAAVNPLFQQAFAQRMRSYLQHDPRPDAAKADIARAWLTGMGEALKADQKNIKAMMTSKTRNKQAIANFVKSRISAVADGVTKKIVDAYKLTPGKPGSKPAGGDKGSDAPTTGVGSISSPIKVKDKPADSNIDWDADPDRMHFISGKAKLLTGSKQWVKWR